MAANIAIVEDKAEIRETWTRMLDGEASLVMRSSHPSAEDALRRLALDKIDLVIVDIVLPRMSGIELIRELKQRKTSLPVLMLTAFNDTEKILASLIAGADGYVLKSSSKPEFITAIKQTLKGGTPLTPSVARKVVQYFRKIDPSDDIASLSHRELAVLRELATGRTYKEIGVILGIDPETVRKHVQNIKRKLQVSTRYEAVGKLESKQLRGFDLVR